MSTPYYGEIFQYSLYLLRKTCPVPVTVRTVNKEVLEKFWSKNGISDDETPFSDCLDISKIDKSGYAVPTKRKWRIRIMRGLTEQEAVDALIHEWAHAMDELQNGPPVDVHRNSWGECYSKAHRAVCYHKE